MSGGDDRRVILAFDQGTTSSRTIAFAPDGSVRGVAQQELRLSFPQPGWVEHGPGGDLGGAARHGGRGAAQAGVQAADVAGIGITNQRETTVIWERATSQPIAPAIVWQDRRTAARCDELRAAGHLDLVRGRTGLVLDPYFSATKIAWLLDYGAGGPRPRGEGRARLRHRGHLAGLAPQRRTAARDRRDQRLADPAVRPAHRLLGRRAARALRRPRRVAAGDRRHERGGGGVRRGRARRAGAAGRHGRRPAGGAVRPGLHGPGHDQGHVRHRLLPAHAHRRRAGGLAGRPAEHGGRADRADAAPTRWRAACSSAAPRCSGCATGSA